MREVVFAARPGVESYRGPDVRRRHRQHRDHQPIWPGVLRVEPKGDHILLADVLEDLVYLSAEVQQYGVWVVRGGRSEWRRAWSVQDGGEYHGMWDRTRQRENECRTKATVRGEETRAGMLTSISPRCIANRARVEVFHQNAGGFTKS